MKSIMDAVRRNTAEQSLIATAIMTNIPICDYVSEYCNNCPLTDENYCEEAYTEWVNGAYNYAKQRYNEDVKNGKKFNKSALAMSIEEFIERKEDAKIENV